MKVVVFKKSFSSPKLVHKFARLLKLVSMSNYNDGSEIKLFFFLSTEQPDLRDINNIDQQAMPEV